jgi:hypothetical protein
VLDQIEHRLLGQVDVLEHEHERLQVASSVAHVCAAQAISDADCSPPPDRIEHADASARRSATASSPQQFRSFSLAARPCRRR